MKKNRNYYSLNFSHEYCENVFRMLFNSSMSALPIIARDGTEKKVFIIEFGVTWFNRLQKQQILVYKYSKSGNDLGGNDGRETEVEKGST